MRNNQKLQQEIDILTKDVLRVVQEEKSKEENIKSHWRELQDEQEENKVYQEKILRENDQLRRNN